MDANVDYNYYNDYSDYNDDRYMNIEVDGQIYRFDTELPNSEPVVLAKDTIITNNTFYDNYF